MSPRVTGAIAARVLRQLRHDHRTLALLLLMPTVILALLRWVFDERPLVFDSLGPALLALIPFTVMFLVTSVTTLRERSSGTLERLLTLPMGRMDLLLGYALAFGAMATLQSGIAAAVSIGLLGMEVESVWLLLVVAVADAVLGTALGLFVSAFARTEFQAVQFMPAFVFPQILLCGLFLPRAQLPAGLHELSDALPLSYAVDAMTLAAQGAAPTGFAGAPDGIWTDLAVIVAFTVALLAAGAATLRRRTA